MNNPLKPLYHRLRKHTAFWLLVPVIIAVMIGGYLTMLFIQPETTALITLILSASVTIGFLVITLLIAAWQWSNLQAERYRDE